LLHVSISKLAISANFINQDQAVAQLQQEPEREVVIYKNEDEPLGISIKGV
jgi:hypothetical protein